VFDIFYELHHQFLNAIYLGGVEAIGLVFIVILFFLLLFLNVCKGTKTSD
jgi:hypothetical protein